MIHNFHFGRKETVSYSNCQLGLHGMTHKNETKKLRCLQIILRMYLLALLDTLI